MKYKSLISCLLAGFVAMALLIGCGSDDDELVDSTDNEVIVKAVTTAPDPAGIVNDPVWDTAEEASIQVGTDSAYGAWFGPAIVRIKGIQDGQNLYLRFNWVDDSESRRPGHWTFQDDAPPFYQKPDTIRGKSGNFLLNQEEAARNLWENEDGLGIFFDYGNNGSERANCGSTCHFRTPNSIGQQHYTTGGGNIDSWMWRAGRTNPFGMAEDLFWGAEQKWDSYDVELYKRNGLSDLDETEPRLMHTSGRNYTGDQLYTQDTTALLFVGQNWQPGDHISGYIYNQAYNTGNTSRYDINARSEYDPQLSRWTLVLWRSLAAPTPSEDVGFNTSNTYEATVAVMRQNAQRHSGSQPFTIKFE